MPKLLAQYFLNHYLDLAEVEWQVEELAKAGYEGIYPHARQGLATPYMSEAWWQAMAKILEVCRKHDMEFWIWDEDYYPSGLAGGRVVWDDPGLIARELRFELVHLEGKDPFEVDFPVGMLLGAYAIRKENGRYTEPLDITRFCGTRRQSWTERRVLHRAYSPLITPLGHPHWRTGMYDNRFAVLWEPEEPGEYLILGVLVADNQGVQPDILRPEAVEKFIEMSYQEYYQRFAGEFGKTIKGSFTDEPSPGCAQFPWTANFPAEFVKDHGYDLLAYLPHLAVDIDERSPQVRHHYRLTQHRLQYQNYLLQIASWCRKHSIQMAGHLTRTEWFSLVAAWWPNELRHYKAIDIPHTDPLGASCGWKDAAAYHSGIKVASSAAHLFGREQAGSDALAVIGEEASLRDLKYLLDYQMVLGINFFTIHGASYSFDGPRKDEVPPSLFYQHSQWPYMHVLNDYVKHTCQELTGGRHLCQIALLYPSTSLACQIKPGIQWQNLDDEKRTHELVEFLLSQQRDFDFIDEVTLRENVTEEGELTTPEKYRYLLLPYLRYIDSRTLEAIGRFAAGGGRVMVIGEKPVGLTGDLSSPTCPWPDIPHQFYEAPDSRLLADLPGLDMEGEGKEDLFVLAREKDGKRVFVCNRREEEFQGRVLGSEVKIPPRGSVLLKSRAGEDSLTVPEEARIRKQEVAAELSGSWDVEFEANQLPLNFWHVVLAENGENPFDAPAFDLLERQEEPEAGSGKVRYYSRFMFSGDAGDLKLVIEDSAIFGEWKLYVNGILIENWQRERLFDCANKTAEIGHAVRGGSTPALNIVTIEAGSGSLKEVLYLCGSFTCEYRYSHRSFPFLRGSTGKLTTTLQPWSVLGYPTFSGRASYQLKFELDKTQALWLDLGRVETLAAVELDGREVKVVPWPPYCCHLGEVAAGVHRLRIEVANSPANRTRAANLPSGLLGPVRLLRDVP